MDITDVGKLVWFPSDYYQSRKDGIEPVGFGRATSGRIDKIRGNTVTVTINNKDRFGAKKYNKRYPASLIFTNKKEVIKYIKENK